jgi:ubiquinone/menaquinone biosynthesis C-methylase UbiE
MSQWFYRWQIRLLAALSPAMLFQRLSELGWYGGLLQEWSGLAIEQPNQRLLDVGCATGYLAGFLYQHGHRVSGVDASRAMISRASRNFPAVEFQLADACQMPFNDGEFDQIFCASLLNVVDRPARLIREMQRIIRPGGRIHFLFPQTDFSERDFVALDKSLKLDGFSRAALHSWHVMALKKTRGEAVGMLQAAGLEIQQEARLLDGMVLSLSVLMPET